MKTGLFWIIAKNKNELDAGKFEIIAHFDGDANHFDIWKQVQSKRHDFQKFGYDYFPRGRLWVANGKRIVLINQVLQKPEIINKISEVFELGTEIEIHDDGCGMPWL